MNFLYRLPDIIPNLHIDLREPPKPPKLRKDPVLDAPEEISKWLAERRKRYPRAGKPLVEDKAKELSILEQKLRKKISLISGSARRTQMKVKQMKDLCKTLTEGQKIRKKEVQEESSESEARESENEKEKTQKEIKKLEKLLVAQNPRQQYKLQKDGQPVQQLNKTDKKNVKQKIKNLRKILNPDAVAPIQVQNKQYTLTADEHKKEMIENLEQQQDKMQELLEQSLDYKVNPANFKYKNNTLVANLLIEEIYKERQYILQAIRYMVKENFFIPKSSIYESITSESEEAEMADSITGDDLLDDEEFF